MRRFNRFDIHRKRSGGYRCWGEIFFNAGSLVGYGILFFIGTRIGMFLRALVEAIIVIAGR